MSQFDEKTNNDFINNNNYYNDNNDNNDKKKSESESEIKSESEKIFEPITNIRIIVKNWATDILIFDINDNSTIIELKKLIISRLNCSLLHLHLFINLEDYDIYSNPLEPDEHIIPILLDDNDRKITSYRIENTTCTDMIIQMFINLAEAGDHVQTIGKKGNAFGEFVGPTGACVSNKGELFVADSQNNRINIFDSTDGHFIHSIGIVGPNNTSILADGQLVNPYSLCISDEGELFVGDNNRIQVFSTFDYTYRFVRKIYIPNQNMRIGHMAISNLTNELYIICVNHIKVIRISDSVLIKTINTGNIGFPIGLGPFVTLNNLYMVVLFVY